MTLLMKRVLFLALFAAACATPSVPVYLQPGTAAFQVQADLAQCRAGVGTSRFDRTAFRPTIGVGVGRCVGAFCVGTSTGNVFDRIDERQAEERGEALGACMGTKGYRLVSLPACRGGRGRVLESHPFDVTGLCTVDGQVAVQQ